jgi:CheY-like chemotaxis protein
MTRSVLVVEDYPDLRTAIVDVLSRNDCVCDCLDSEQAIAKLRSTQYETILIAPRLSISGDPVLHFLAENQPNELSRVVVMTNPADEEETPDARCHVLAKPFSRDELLRQIAATSGTGPRRLSLR